MAERLKAKNDNEIKRSYNNNNNCIKKGNIQIEYFLDRIILTYQLITGKINNIEDMVVYAKKWLIQINRK